MAFVPRPQEIYRHFKGNLYQVIAVAEHSETGEELVVYQALYGDFKTYARPLEMFVSRVDCEKYPDAEQEFRFELQGEDSERQKRESGAAAPEDDAVSAAGAAAPESESESGAAPAVGPAESESEAAAAAAMPEDAAADTEPEKDAAQLDPLLLKFLDADTYEERLNILVGLHHRITQDMITSMAVVCDIEVEQEDLEERYEALKNCLITLEKYECNRVR